MPTELNVYCEMASCLTTAKEMEKYGDNLKGIILSGGPFSVYDKEAPHLDKAVSMEGETTLLDVGGGTGLYS